jgi:hypothetical protein
MAGLAQLAQRHGDGEIAFTYDDTGASYYAASAGLGGREYDFEVYDSVAYAQNGQSRYESGIFDYPDKLAEAEDFLRRLDRLLTTGSWFSDDDPGIADSIKNTVKRLFRRNTPTKT